MIYRIFFICSLFIACTSCKSEAKKKAELFEKLPIAERIAEVHGIENWKKVKSIAFTFNVDKDSSHFERQWIWHPKQHKVTAIKVDTIISYTRNDKDLSKHLKEDQAFINDAYWLLAPFHLIWDQGIQISEPSQAIAPISQTKYNMITLLYSDQGGYTPGDAYDFYYDEDYLIKEWVFRKSNSPEASLITTWEDYSDHKGLKIARSHKQPDGLWNLNFTNIEIVQE